MTSLTELGNNAVFFATTSFFAWFDTALTELCFFFLLALAGFFLCNRAIMLQNDLAGQEGFEPPTPGFGVRRSTVRATGLHYPFQINGPFSSPSFLGHKITYLVSLCKVCLLQNLQYLLNSNLSGVVRLFFVVV